jgi:hypothetical protein
MEIVENDLDMIGHVEEGNLGVWRSPAVTPKLVETKLTD